MRRSIVLASAMCVSLLSVPAFAGTLPRYGAYPRHPAIFEAPTGGMFNAQIGGVANAPSGTFVCSADARMFDVPPTPPVGGDVSYWIGIQSQQVGWIVQPVLAFGSDWNCANVNDHWYIQAYELDNNDSCHNGTTYLVNPGDDLLFNIYLDHINFDSNSNPTQMVWVNEVTDITSNVTSSLTYTVPYEPTSIGAIQEWAYASSCASPTPVVASLDYVNVTYCTIAPSTALGYLIDQSVPWGLTEFDSSPFTLACPYKTSIFPPGPNNSDPSLIFSN